MIYIDLAEDLVPVYLSGYTGDEELELELMADADEEFDYEFPNETEWWA